MSCKPSESLKLGRVEASILQVMKLLRDHHPRRRLPLQEKGTDREAQANKTSHPPARISVLRTDMMGQAPHRPAIS